jgi:hypothetical protein
MVRLGVVFGKEEPMSLTIPQALHWWQQHLGRSIHFPAIPPTCEQVMARARTAGIPVGTLYIVSRPLSAGSMGTYDRETGDLCCHYEASQGEEGQREVLRTLLILIASIKLQIPVPHTIAQEWEFVRQAIEEGYHLARQWDSPSVFTEADFTRMLTRSAELAYGHHLAADLAGHRSPWVARTAYSALDARRSEMSTLDTPERFIEALAGTSANPASNDALVRFDRSLLRERWAVTCTRPQGEHPSFGDLTVPGGSRAAQMLRVALSRAASWPHDTISESARSSWFQEVAEETDLAVLIRVWNGWLIETHPQAAVRLAAWAYGDGYRLAIGSPRVYRVALSYEDASIDGPPTRDLWVLFAEHPTPEQRALEGAWQVFLADWLTWSTLECGPLARGLQHLWLQGGQV